MRTEILNKMDRIHPYPAKFTIDLAIEYIKRYSKPGDLVYDPFVGSGTTLLAASVMGRRSVGTDINHIAILIAKFKLLKLTKTDFYSLERYIDNFANNFATELEHVELYYYPSIDHWFCDNSIAVLSYIKSTISELENENQKLFCQLVMSSIINTVSNQESDTRYAAIERPDLTKEKVVTIYIKKFTSILAIFKEFNAIERTCDANAYLLDSRLCKELLGENSVDLILTSPPYVNTYDYYLYHKHRMNWLGYDVKFSMEKEIGSRREFSSLKHEESKFSSDLKDILLACDDTLKIGGHVVLVIGDGRVAGKIYDAKENAEKICTQIGWKLEDYSFSYLDLTSRSFQKSYRTKGKKEHILVFKKG